MPKVTRNDPYCVVVNGDAMDGRHHSSTTQISQNVKDQLNIAMEILAPVADLCNGRIYMVRGTEVHTGPTAENEEELASRLGAIQDETGNHSRYELYLKIGRCLAHFSHHIGITGSMHYETTALMKEFAESCSDAARWGIDTPDVVVRSHRHRHAEVRVPTRNAYGYCFTTSGWQLKTPFVFRTPGGRISTPTIGGSLIRQGDEEFFTRHKTWPIKRSRIEIPTIEESYGELG